MLENKDGERDYLGNRRFVFQGYGKRRSVLPMGGFSLFLRCLGRGFRGDLCKENQ